MNTRTIKDSFSIGLQPWRTADPFLFCVYHQDDYPKGNAELGPDVALSGRALGHDFVKRDGFRMYHGQQVPGFPQHPHRGFETITIALEGHVDHSDSLGSTSRYGFGDVQWMTAGKGIQHAEMFPLRDRESMNRLKLFQIWLNLPARDKLVAPHITMHWSESIPSARLVDGSGLGIKFSVFAGVFESLKALDPAPSSWAADSNNQVSIVHIELDAGARWLLPKAAPELTRMLYFYEGGELHLDGQRAEPGTGLELLSDQPLSLENGTTPSSVLLLQGRPIDEPVVSHGPFVMNSEAEIRQAYQDYHAGLFGSWPWGRSDPVHPAEKGRFSINLDGTRDEPEPSSEK